MQGAHSRARGCCSQATKKSHERIRGASKVMAHLMFGVMTLTADQILKLVG